MAGGFAKRGGRGGSRGGAKKRSNDDDDTAPRAFKRAKADEDDDDAADFVPTLQKDSNGDQFVSLKANDTRRVTISEFKGKTLISIREYYEADGEKRPGKKGISLPLDQYNALLAAAPLIESVLLKKKEEVVRPDYNGEAAAAAPAAKEQAEEAEQEVDEPVNKADDDSEDEPVYKADDE